MTNSIFIFRRDYRLSDNTGLIECCKNSDNVYRKVYISRSRLPKGKRLFMEEPILESILSKQGWHIYHPQEHCINEQIKVYEQAEFISSTEGSAIHCLYAISTNNLKKVMLLSRNKCNNMSAQLGAQNIDYLNLVCLETCPDCTKAAIFKNVQVNQDFNIEEIAKIIDLESK